MPDRYKTSDLIQGKVLAALPWQGGCKTETVARYIELSEDTARSALEDLVRRRMVMIDDRNYWRKSHWVDAGASVVNRPYNLSRKSKPKRCEMARRNYRPV